MDVMQLFNLNDCFWLYLSSPDRNRPEITAWRKCDLGPPARHSILVSFSVNTGGQRRQDMYILLGKATPRASLTLLQTHPELFCWPDYNSQTSCETIYAIISEIKMATAPMFDARSKASWYISSAIYFPALYFENKLRSIIYCSSIIKPFL